MLNKLLIKIVKKVGYVQELETRVEQLKAVETRLREEKGDAVIEKKRAALKLKLPQPGGSPTGKTPCRNASQTIPNRIPDPTKIVHVTAISKNA